MNISLIYSSTAVGAPDVESLLIKCRAANQRVGVTGLLLFEHGHFLQALEGHPPTVHACFDRITRDPRHTDVRVLSEEPIVGRRYPDWAMGFGHSTDAAAGSLAPYLAQLT